MLPASSRGGQGGRVAEVAAVEVGADHQLAHAAARGQRRQAVGQPPGPGVVVLLDGGGDHGVEDVAPAPLVAVADPGAADVRLLRPGRGLGMVAHGGPEQPQPTRGHALPAGVAQLAGQRVGMLEPLAGGGEAAGAELQLASRACGQGRKAIHRCSWTSSRERPRAKAAWLRSSRSGWARARSDSDQACWRASPPRSARSTDSRRCSKAAGYSATSEASWPAPRGSGRAGRRCRPAPRPWPARPRRSGAGRPAPRRTPAPGGR